MSRKLRIRVLGLLAMLGALWVCGCGTSDSPPKDPSLVPPPGQAADDLPGAQQKK